MRLDLARSEVISYPLFACLLCMLDTHLPAFLYICYDLFKLKI